MRRRLILALVVSPVLAMTGCGSGEKTTAPDETTSAPMTPTATSSVSLAQREWDLSSAEQRAEYCTSYRQRTTLTPQDLGYSRQDVTEEFVESFRDLLEEKC